MKSPYAGLVINAGRYNDPKPSPRTILRREKLARAEYRAKRLEQMEALQRSDTRSSS